MRLWNDDLGAVIFDVDGTLVDSNYEHVLAWSQAFKAVDVHVPAWVIHRHVGMGGDQLVAAVAGDEVEREHGDRIRELERERYVELIDDVRAFPAARNVLAACRSVGLTVVLASSAKGEELERYLDLLEGRDLADAWTASPDVTRTKPAPDLIAVALEKAGTDAAVMVGDSVWDVVAARNIGIPTIGLLTGGFGEDELRSAGAVDVLSSLDEIDNRLLDRTERDARSTDVEAASPA
jgi:HAD superfamily hydrolase (TIGR01509 family)